MAVTLTKSGRTLSVTGSMIMWETVDFTVTGGSFTGDQTLWLHIADGRRPLAWQQQRIVDMEQLVIGGGNGTATVDFNTGQCAGMFKRGEPTADIWIGVWDEDNEEWIAWVLTQLQWAPQPNGTWAIPVADTQYTAAQMDATFVRLDGANDYSKIVLAGATELTIASDAVTVVKAVHKIDTEGNAASDSLSTINGGSDGQLILLFAANASRTVILKDGIGNLELGGSDVSLTDTNKSVMLYYDGTLSKWIIAGGGGSAGYAVQTFTAQTSITVVHNLGAYPLVQVLGADGAVVGPYTVSHTSVDSLMVTFTESTTGTIICCGGAMGSEIQIPTSAFTQDGGILVGTGAGGYQEETGSTVRASIGAEEANANIQAHVTGTGSPHTPAGIGSPALSLLTAAGSWFRASGAGAVVEAKCLVTLPSAGAGGWSPALTANGLHTVTRTGIWTGITPSGLEIGEGCCGVITGAYATTTTGVTADFSGALDDIAAASVGFVIWREAAGYRMVCWEKA